MKDVVWKKPQMAVVQHSALSGVVLSTICDKNYSKGCDQAYEGRVPFPIPLPTRLKKR